MDYDTGFEERPYQIECEDALLNDVLHVPGCNPVVAIPTGGGKSKILSAFIYKYLEERPTHNVLVISHTETIVKQNHETIERFFPGIYIGLYSSGLGSKTIEKITVAGIQSIYKKGKLFKNIDLIIVDEVHAVPVKGNGMYKKFFKSVESRRVGLSGTPFRSGHGYVHVGEDALFNKLSYNLCNMDKFNKLVQDGYLTELFSKPPNLQMDTRGIKQSAGDYNLKHLAQEFDRDSITKKAIKELIKFGKNYKSWLVFAIDIDHADHINNELLKHEIRSVVLHSRSNSNRHEVKKWFVRGDIRAIVSVGMVTTGFDAPNIDLLVLLRPTTSPVLHVQMIGRGLRVCEGKTHCLVLDFAGNVSRLGPINNVEIPTPGKKKNGNGEPIVKQCPQCGCLHHPTIKICSVCNHVFQFITKLKPTFDSKEVVTKETKNTWLDVTNVKYFIHKKANKPDSLRVQYNCGLFSFSEWICYEHTGYAKYKANNWVKQRWIYETLPPSVEVLYKFSKYLKEPQQVLIDLHAKYPVIMDNKFFKEN